MVFRADGFDRQGELIDRHNLWDLVGASYKRAMYSGMTDTAHDFKGPYRNDGPDLLTGFAEGYRVSWDCARGVVTSETFEDNTKSWSGDHCMDPRIVPGILFTNLRVDDSSPSLMDMAPTVLDLFGIDAPEHMVGKSLVKVEA